MGFVEDKILYSVKDSMMGLRSPGKCWFFILFDLFTPEKNYIRTTIYYLCYAMHARMHVYSRVDVYVYCSQALQARGT